MKTFWKVTNFPKGVGKLLFTNSHSEIFANRESDSRFVKIFNLTPATPPTSDTPHSTQKATRACLFQ
jgi:hypothetical protein